MRASELLDQWRAGLVERPSDSAAESLELVLSDPSRQNVVQAVEQLNAADLVTRTTAFEVLSILMQNDYLSESNELSAAMEEIRSALRLAEGSRETSSTVSTPEQ